MSNKKELRLTGSGGQGLILGGIILAEAGILEGKNAIQSQSYGPEARGGASKAEVIISNDEIDFPKVQSVDMLLCLTQIAADKYAKEVNENTTLIVDTKVKLEDNINCGKVVQLPILDTAANEVGKIVVANIVALGVINGVLGLVEKESLEKAVLSRVPKGTEELNKKALYEGYKLVENL
ncbi:MAG: 2-oxoacid:acceptor oxidoreductase family protein [Anaeromicrobium sp.]|jgi:2-oxoglutarate ferredoxin oxidoreductase subunit gamma|uniref:2-oxoacid:acceptor oxidoreductase family protein n=1 Tax=Anaeromicrobium sp. TaxID=1929132 RepID=UPI0025E112F0|nr:2-oxoacid:acceptor oxidoreductase family protein [Anaeromicrobium sp.]MCT4594704.1 2-oxoacid:acceptor oxidoreductase family protein [Anaeromicrobium sp.]